MMRKSSRRLVLRTCELSLKTKSVRSLLEYLAVVLVVLSAIVSGQQPTLVTQTGQTGEVISVAVKRSSSALTGRRSVRSHWLTSSRRMSCRNGCMISTRVSWC